MASGGRAGLWAILVVGALGTGCALDNEANSRTNQGPLHNPILPKSFRVSKGQPLTPTSNSKDTCSRLPPATPEPGVKTSELPTISNSKEPKSFEPETLVGLSWPEAERLARSHGWWTVIATQDGGPTPTIEHIGPRIEVHLKQGTVSSIQTHHR